MDRRKLAAETKVHSGRSTQMARRSRRGRRVSVAVLVDAKIKRHCKQQQAEGMLAAPRQAQVGSHLGAQTRNWIRI